MPYMTINKNWKFHYGDEPSAFQKDFNDSSWQSVTVPHDWSVTMPFDRTCSSGTGYLPGGTAWYRKSFTLPEEAKGKRVRVVFDGIYKNAKIWCNSYYLGEYPYGYSEIALDVTDFACFGETENVLSVRVEREDLADSRWFTGCGIYRKVSVEISEQVGFDHHGVFFAVYEADDSKAVFVISSELQNHTGEEQKVALRHELLDEKGTSAAVVESQEVLAPFEKKMVLLKGEVKNPALWSPAHPNLYRLVSTANEDRVENQVGLRAVRFDADEGFFCNGVNMKLKGVCVHHDAGTLGAAVTKKVWKRRLKKLKAMGCNTIRMSHNPHQPELFDLCDEMGFFVIDEAFDEWEGCKNKWSTGHNVYPPKHYGYYENFPQWHEHDLKTLVRRDRNHACVLMWSIGNEIDYPNDPYCHPLFQTATGNNDANKPAAERMYNPAKPNMERLATLAAMLAKEVKDEDATRPVTAAAAFPELSSRLGFLDSLDVVGYNYKEQYYEEDHKRFPEKPFFGSENGHSMDAWRAVRDSKNIFGQCLWTGIDFFGETILWPMHGSSAGLMTTAGFEKPQYYYRQGLWAETPTVALVTATASNEKKEAWDFARNWNYAPGETVEIRCYSSHGAPTVTLNGRKLEMECQTEENGSYVCVVPYEEGVLSAQCEGAEDTLETTGAAVAIQMEQIDCLKADGEDMAQIEVTLVDSKGRRVYTGSTELKVAVEGEASLIALDNGDLFDPTDCQSPIRHAYRGQMMIYIRSTETAGKAVIKVTGEGLRPQCLTVETK